jgi:D-lactate dehydrogenase
VKISVFSTKPYDRRFLEEANQDGGFGHELLFFEPRLDDTTVPLAHGSPAVSAFVNDDLGEPVLADLAAHGTRLIALRSAGFNNVDLEAAADLGVRVMRVPDYSPYAVAEFTLALILSLDRHLSRAYTRVREGNFSLDGLLGFDVHARTAGIIGTGKIGGIVARNLRHGFGCRVLAYDPFPSHELATDGVRYVELDELFAASDIVSLHCPLMPETHHLIDREAIAKMKRGVMLINTSRGGLIDTGVVIAALKSGRIGHLGLDVYEEEARFFYEDYSSRLIQDDTLSRLLTFPNVIVTSHQGFFTVEAMQQIAHTTLSNARCYEESCESPNEVRARPGAENGRLAA